MLMRLAPVLLPVGLFVLVALFGVFRLFRFLRLLKGSQATLSGGNAGKSLHLETPLGSVALHPHSGTDPGLASISKYPAAVPVDPNPSGFDAEIHLAGHDGRFIGTQFWTADPIGDVVAFYQRELATWKDDHNFLHGRRFTDEQPDCARAVTIRYNTGRTLIEHSAVYPSGAG